MTQPSAKPNTQPHSRVLHDAEYLLTGRKKSSKAKSKSGGGGADIGPNGEDYAVELQRYYTQLKLTSVEDVDDNEGGRLDVRGVKHHDEGRQPTGGQQATMMMSHTHLYNTTTSADNHNSGGDSSGINKNAANMQLDYDRYIIKRDRADVFLNTDNSSSNTIAAAAPTPTPAAAEAAAAAKAVSSIKSGVLNPGNAVINSKVLNVNNGSAGVSLSGGQSSLGGGLFSLGGGQSSVSGGHSSLGGGHYSLSGGQSSLSGGQTSLGGGGLSEGGQLTLGQPAVQRSLNASDDPRRYETKSSRNVTSDIVDDVNIYRHENILYVTKF